MTKISAIPNPQSAQIARLGKPQTRRSDASFEKLIQGYDDRRQSSPSLAKRVKDARQDADSKSSRRTTRSGIDTDRRTKADSKRARNETRSLSDSQRPSRSSDSRPKQAIGSDADTASRPFATDLTESSTDRAVENQEVVLGSGADSAVTPQGAAPFNTAQTAASSAATQPQGVSTGEASPFNVLGAGVSTISLQDATAINLGLQQGKAVSGKDTGDAQTDAQTPDTARNSSGLLSESPATSSGEFSQDNVPAQLNILQGGDLATDAAKASQAKAAAGLAQAGRAAQPNHTGTGFTPSAASESPTQAVATTAETSDSSANQGGGEFDSQPNQDQPNQSPHQSVNSSRAAGSSTPLHALSNATVAASGLHIDAAPAAPPVATGAAAQAQPQTLMPQLSDPEANSGGANVGRVMRGMHGVINQNGGAVTLRLSPPEMGIVRIEMQLEGGTVNAQIHTEHESARSLLNQQLGQLRHTLEAQGLSVERLTVQTMNQDQAAFNHADRDADQQMPDGRSRGRWADQGRGGGQRGRSDHDGGRGSREQKPASFESELNTAA